MVHVHVHTFPGLSPLDITSDASIELDELVATIYSQLPATLIASTYLTLRSGKPLVSPYISSDVDLRLSPRLCGGKGGFGSQLRAQGGRMARRKRGVEDETSKDHFRNLDGRRMRSIRQAKELALYLESAPQRLKDEARAKRDRLEAIIAMQPPGANARFEDTEFLEQSEEMIEDLKRLVDHSVQEYGGARFTAAEDESGEEHESEEEEQIAHSSESISPSRSSSSSSSVRKPRMASFFDEEEEDGEDDDA